MSSWVYFTILKVLFHKSYIAAYNKQKLSRKQKLKGNENGDKSDSCTMNLKMKKRVKTRLEFRKTLEQCFFCGKRDEPNLRKCLTLELHNCVKNAAQNLNDFNLLVKRTCWRVIQNIIRIVWLHYTDKGKKLILPIVTMKRSCKIHLFSYHRFL